MKPIQRPGRSARPLLWGALGLWAAGLGVFWLTRPAQAAPEPGETVIPAGTRARSVLGSEMTLLPRDSAVVVLGATSECAACRVGLPAYRQIAERLRQEGVAFRVIVGSDSLAARQFSRLLPDARAVVWDPDQALFRTARIRTVPTMYLLGRDGRLRRSWSPVPSDPRFVDAVAAAARAARAAR